MRERETGRESEAESGDRVKKTEQLSKHGREIEREREREKKKRD